ncbi:MAG: hypothetical protein HY661_15410 [Betaproteobacteria bacterium]|nr:hypothetical protein [Betaproteobacteria bacterium]
MPAIKPLLGSGFVCAALFALASTALAQNYAGQTVTMLMNNAAGGPTDVEARIVARHLPKYLQGATSVIIRNVPGAGGNIGTNQLGEATGRETLTVGYLTWNPVTQIINEPTLHVRYENFKFIAGVRQTTLLYVRRDTKPGISKPADVAKAQLFRAGAMGPASQGTIRLRLALDLLGAKYETIPGYKGVREIEFAVRQGDIQVTNNSLPGYFTSVKPNLIDTGIAIPLFQYDVVPTRPSRSPDLPDVPSYLEVYKDVWGKDAMPSGEKWQALVLLNRIMDSMIRTIFMAPTAPQAAVDEMRGAFEKLSKDPEFIAQWEKVVLVKPRFILGAEGERVVSDLANIQPAMAEFLRKYIAEMK